MKKILHVASFRGNIGDNLSHMGFYTLLKSLNFNYQLTQLEIRKAYKNYTLPDKLVFNSEFVEYANKFDYVVFGGGSFLDYWIQGSVNGTTIDIRNELLSKITAKVLFTSIGANPNRVVPLENYNKFKSFLDFVKSEANITIALRNDGSLNSITKIFGRKYSSMFNQVLDHAFFYSSKCEHNKSYPEKFIAINITIDQLEMASINPTDSEYTDELKRTVYHFVNSGYKIIFIPHIHLDLIAITDFLKLIPSSFIRDNISVAPYLQGDNGAEQLFNIYKNASLIIASRFHSIVCGFRFDIPTIGLSPLPRVQYLYDQLSLSKVDTLITKDFAARITDYHNNPKTIAVNKVELYKLREKTINFYKNFFM